MGSEGRAATKVASAVYWRRRSRRWMGVALLGCFLLGGALTGLARVQAPIDGGSAPSGLDIFSSVTNTPSVLPEMGSAFEPRTVHPLTVGADDPSVFAAEDLRGQPCLLAVYLGGEQFSTCSTPAAFAVDGLQLRTVTHRLLQPGGPYPQRVDARDIIFWAPDGTCTLTSTTLP